ncbi:MAG: hypothetical protein PHD58_11415, partial [Anaerolineales bacterium]|nr:hypothetical protein [Anaerolineales bacterium]
MSDFDQLLQKQLEALEAGAPLEQVLRELPAEARGLAPLIRLASTVRSMPHPQPRTAALPAIQKRAASEVATRPIRPRLRFDWTWKRLALVGGAAGAALVLLVAVISLLGLNLWFGGATSARAATLMDVIGQVEVASSAAAQDWKPVSDGDTVSAGQVIRTAADGSATLVFYEGSRAELNPNTVLVLEAVSGGWGKALKVVLQQRSGETYHSVVPLRGKASR